MSRPRTGSWPGRRSPPVPRPPFILLAAIVAFVATAAMLALASESGHRDPASVRVATARTPLRPGASTDERIARQQAAVRAAPRDADAYVALAASYVQKARETGDPSHYERAEDAVTRALALAPDHAGALTERGTLRLARHDFRGALRDGRDARALAPDLVRPYGVLVDAYAELGRYRQAARALQRMVDLKPELAAYARVSYFRELHGDLPGATEAMRLAVSAAGGTGENAAYVATLLGDLQLARGRVGAAERAYEEALARFAGYVPARAGLARVYAARGELAAAIRMQRAVVDRLPAPEHVVELGEAELAAGRRAQAARDLALVRAQGRLLRAGGFNTDVELAVYEASYGDPRAAVTLAERAWASAPSVRSADALGWALTQAGRPREGLGWARRALRLGSRDPMFLVHAGLSARAAGRPALARRWLAASLADNPRFSPLWAPRARRALRSLG
jgi:tetratricopeptide (TPR) repeat protein